ncbi:innexin inx2-like [Bacillus rossius redtenbacheri]|uniref:innexin inx2-like n=1 Tax=Bacillus rossius redtenbacheri TaxID=93214 RepID=UPI002FDCDF49
MLDVLKSMRGLLKVQTINIDNNVFCLHYKFTTLVLLFCVVITSRQFFRESMECYLPDLPAVSLNTYCLIHSTFLVKDSASANAARKSLPYPGMSQHTEEDKLRFYDYYQWGFITLFLQAICFYLPHQLWKVWEGGRMKMLAVNLTTPVLSEECIKKSTDLLIEYWEKQLHSHNSYYYRFLTCELINLSNVVGQICFMNAFLGEEFQYYGLNVIMSNWKKGLQQEITNPTQRLFPTMTKCSYKKFGPSGSMETRDGMCILAQNAINQKVYLLLWFWFHILAIISALFIVYHLFTLVAPGIRLRQLRSASNLNGAKDIKVMLYERDLKETVDIKTQKPTGGCGRWTAGCGWTPGPMTERCAELVKGDCRSLVE